MFYSHVGDRASLVRVLAMAARQNVGLRRVEDFVVLSSPAIPDSVTMLFDAFEISKSPEAKAAIAGGLRFGFAFAGPLPADDAELVAWARKWYEEHRATYVPDEDYSVRSNMFSADGPEKNSLFKPR
ncbi:MAG: hypothetical protein KF691_00930 [Phycisphaeraceae bacterium]|nr:hypothetical protein [Phycisphaeraceae bacterium]